MGREAVGRAGRQAVRQWSGQPCAGSQAVEWAVLRAGRCRRPPGRSRSRKRSRGPWARGRAARPGGGGPARLGGSGAGNAPVAGRSGGGGAGAGGAAGSRAPGERAWSGRASSGVGGGSGEPGLGVPGPRGGDRPRCGRGLGRAKPGPSSWPRCGAEVKAPGDPRERPRWSGGRGRLEYAWAGEWFGKSCGDTKPARLGFSWGEGVVPGSVSELARLRWWLWLRPGSVLAVSAAGNALAALERSLSDTEPTAIS